MDTADRHRRRGGRREGGGGGVSLKCHWFTSGTVKTHVPLSHEEGGMEENGRREERE